MNEDDEWNDDYQAEELSARFEDMLKCNGHQYFDATEFEVIIDYYQQKDDKTRSRLALNLAIELHPTSSDIKIKLARQFLMENTPEEALRVLNELTPPYDNTDYHTTLGSVYSWIGKQEQSIAAYKKALRGLEKDECEDIYNAIATEYTNLHEYDTAIKYFKKGLIGCSDYENQYLNIRSCYIFQNQTHEAIDFFKSEIEKDLYSVEARMALAYCYLQLELLELAVDEFEFVLSIDPLHEKAYTEMCSTLIDLELFQEAISNIQEAFRNKVDTPMLHCLLGECYSRTENNFEALQCFQDAINMDNQTTEAYVGIGIVYSDLGKSEVAVKYFEKALQLDPLEPEYTYYLVEEYNKIQEFSKSIEVLKNLEEVNPFDDKLYVAFMDTYLMDNNIEKAIEYIDSGLNNNPNSALLLYKYAYLFFLSDKRIMAFIKLGEALELDNEACEEEFLELDDSLRDDIEICDFINQFRKKLPGFQIENKQ